DLLQHQRQVEGMQEAVADDDAEQQDGEQQDDERNDRRVAVQEMLQPAKEGGVLLLEDRNGLAGEKRALELGWASRAGRVRGAAHRRSLFRRSPEDEKGRAVAKDRSSHLRRLGRCRRSAPALL